MGIIELLLVILLLCIIFGFVFGRGRW